MEGIIGELFDFTPPQIIILLNGDQDRRKYKICRKESDTFISDESSQFAIYHLGEPIEGEIILKFKESKQFEHQGVHLELIGSIRYPQSNISKVFFNQSEDLLSSGILNDHVSRLPFKFGQGVPASESNYGSFMDSPELEIKYFLRVTIGRLLADLHQERTLWIDTLPVTKAQDLESKYLEIGIENYIRMDFVIENIDLSMSSAIKGYLFFHLLNLPIVSAKLVLLQKICKLENEGVIMPITQSIIKSQQVIDGIPIANVKVPFSFPLLDCLLAGNLPAGGTIPEIGKLWSVRYFFQLVLIDSQHRHYFKQQEVNLHLSTTDNAELEKNLKYENLIYKLKASC